MDDTTDSMDTETSSAPQPEQSQAGMETQSSTPVMENAPAQSADENNDHKLYAILGYILPFLFFLPLVQDSSKNNAFARFHANQQLILLIVVVGLYAIHNILYIMLMAGGFFVVQLLNLAVLVLAILGILNAAQGQMKELPVIGKFRLLK